MIPVAAVPLLLSLSWVCDDGNTHRKQAPPAVGLAAARALAPAAGEIWTTDRLRAFLLDLHAAIDKKRDEHFPRMKDSDVLGTCHGGAAVRLARISDVAPVLEQRLTGRALTCYEATYFGCRIGPWLATAGLARFSGAPYLPHDASLIRIIEQTPTRLVADVREASVDVVWDGVIHWSHVGVGQDIHDQSRYTLVRDDQGIWRISDRKPRFPEWECQPR